MVALSKSPGNLSGLIVCYFPGVALTVGTTAGILCIIIAMLILMLAFNSVMPCCSANSEALL
jgi:hypothetical protein